MVDFNVTRRGILMGVSAAGFASLSGCNWLTKKPNVAINLRQEWFPYSGFAGEALAAANYASEFGVTLNLLAGGETVDPIKMVLSRQDDMGVASGDILMKAIADGAPLVAIGVANDRSPTCFLSKTSSGIVKPQDFPGKRVGVLKGTNTERIYRLMLARNKINPADITEIDAPFELNTFILGQYDVRPAFVYDEPVTLENSNIAVNTILPTDYGVNFVGTVYFTRREVIAQRRDALVRTLASLIAAWRATATASGQHLAIDALKKAFPEIDTARELNSLKIAAPYFGGPMGSNRPLTVTPSHLADTLAGLQELGEVKKPLQISQVWDESLLNEAYRLVKI